MSIEFKDRSIDWLDGYLSACYDYAVWQNGEMYLGCGMTKYKTIKDIIVSTVKEKEKELIK